jgi:hypothetical protein
MLYAVHHHMCSNNQPELSSVPRGSPGGFPVTWATKYIIRWNRMCVLFLQSRRVQAVDVDRFLVCNRLWVQLYVSAGVFHHSGYHFSGLSATPSAHEATSMEIPAHMSVMIHPM